MLNKGDFMKTYKQILTVGKNREILIEGVPYSPGSKVEVTVLPRGESIFEYTDNLVQKKGIPRYTLKEVEDIIHEYRGIK
jgi:hypothetical protein